MNKIIYKSTYHGKNFEFNDVDMLQGTLTDVLNEALISETLSIDTASFTLRGRETYPEILQDETLDDLYDEDGDILSSWALPYSKTDFTKFTYGDEVDIYVNNVLQGKYFLVDVTVSGKNASEITFSCESLMGLLDGIEYNGGMYSGTTAGEIIADIMGDFPYSIDADLSAIKIYGHIPYASCLTALTYVLFAVGGSVIKDSNQDVYFTFNLPQTATAFDADDLFIGGERVAIDPVTLVKLTEHNFYPSILAEDEILYENTDGVLAERYKIVFDKPYHSLVASGLTIDASGANWATVSGIGTLTGKPYVHIQRIKNSATGLSGKPNEKTVKECTLISAANSEQTLKRVVAYYRQTEEVNATILTNSEKAGSMVEIPDPADISKTIKGYIKSMRRSFSSNIKSAITITQNWKPSFVGNDYDSYLIVRKDDISNGTWTVPAALRGKRALVVLFGGAQGGAGGWYGETTANLVNGNQGYRSRFDAYLAASPYTYHNYYIGLLGDRGTGGLGGNPGIGGKIGKMLQVNIASLADSYTVSFGNGGLGGTKGTVVRNARNFDLTLTDPTDGQFGTHTVFNGTYDTDDGTDIGADFVNFVTGEVLARSRGNDGTPGAKGGNGGKSVYYRDTNSPLDYSVEGRGEKGGNVGSNTGGIGGNGTVGILGTRTQRGTDYRNIMLSGGGGGGGAANGANGGNGTAQSVWHEVSSNHYQTGLLDETGANTTVTSANGGDGANAAYAPLQADLTGGDGGHGGGGGGGAGQVFGKNTDLTSLITYGWALNGKGGNGTDGGQGSDGWMAVFYKAS